MPTFIVKSKTRSFIRKYLFFQVSFEWNIYRL